MERVVRDAAMLRLLRFHDLVADGGIPLRPLRRVHNVIENTEEVARVSVQAIIYYLLVALAVWVFVVDVDVRQAEIDKFDFWKARSETCLCCWSRVSDDDVAEMKVSMCDWWVALAMEEVDR